jgi:hypothetical protein
VKDFAAVTHRRNKVSEQWLIEQLGVLSRQLRRQLPQQTQRQLLLQDLAEQMELFSLGCGLSAPQAAGSGAGMTMQDGAQLPGRQSGAEDWKAARGESGKQ